MWSSSSKKKKVIKNCFNYLARNLCELFPVCLNAGKISFSSSFFFWFFFRLLGQWYEKLVGINLIIKLMHKIEFVFFFCDLNKVFKEIF